MYGDTIGFWDGGRLVTHTKYLLPADFTRWSAEAIERWKGWLAKGYTSNIEAQNAK